MLTIIYKPTVAVFEKRAAALEGGTAAVGTCSGQAAIFNTIICLAGTGDNVVASINLYGGTYSLFKTLLPRLGIEVRWAKQETREEYAKHIDDKTKLFFVESIGNPRCSIPDLQGLADVAHENHIPFVVCRIPQLKPFPKFVCLMATARLTTPSVHAAHGAGPRTLEPISSCIRPPSGWAVTAPPSAA
jgi:O-acetylhomoserine/O-acetylserine sulfhydrylase-like pyridoxal-dependent enzyme